MAASFLNQAAQPGDGAWLLHNGPSKRSRRRRKVKSFLLPNTESGYPAEDEVEVEVKAEPAQGSLLRPTYEIGKEPVSQAPDAGGHEPRTIRSEKPLSPKQQTSSQPPPPASRPCPRTRTNDTNTSPHQVSSAASTSNNSSNKMAIPPHLRRRKVRPSFHNSSDPPTRDTTPPTESTMGRKKPAAVDTTANNPSGLLTPPPTAAHGVSIIEKLQDLGVVVSEPKPAPSAKSSLVPYLGSNRGEERVANGARSQRNGQTPSAWNKDTRTQSSTAGGAKDHDSGWQPTRRGRGSRSRGGRANAGTPAVLLPPRTTASPSKPRGRPGRWPKNSEMRPPSAKRHGTRWNERDTWPAESVAASDWGKSNGWGDLNRRPEIDPETGFKLTGWDGGWAPVSCPLSVSCVHCVTDCFYQAPLDWDARPAFRAKQSAAKIMRWMDVIDADLVGQTWAVPVQELTAISGEYGEIAPHYWIPIIIGNQAPQTFWNEVIKSNEPLPAEEGDLDGAMPWWELYEVKDGNLLEPCKHPKIEGIDPDESLNDRLARETDFGSAQHAANKKRLEKAKIDAEREQRRRDKEKARKLAKSLPGGQPIKPGVKLYIRSAKPADLKAIRDIYNYYVDNSVSTPEIARRSLVHMDMRYKEIMSNKLPFLVACQRGEVIKPRRKKDADDIILPETVLGFAFADDYNDMLGLYRFTVEAEVWVHKDFYMKNIGKCLMDKLMNMLDPEYIERGGYDIVGPELEGMGPSRMIQNIMINLPYDADKPARLEWLSNWLNKWIGFEKSADLKGVGLKNGAKYAILSSRLNTCSG